MSSAWGGGGKSIEEKGEEKDEEETLSGPSICDERSDPTAADQG